MRHGSPEPIQLLFVCVYCRFGWQAPSAEQRAAPSPCTSGAEVASPAAGRVIRGSAVPARLLNAFFLPPGCRVCIQSRGVFGRPRQTYNYLVPDRIAGPSILFVSLPPGVPHLQRSCRSANLDLFLLQALRVESSVQRLCLVQKQAQLRY
ncbi:hypothetical protein NDU88_003021 [Pleurodeles waltl]|uniref:Secreted protein n=1 Tax=Pleurodeles waltl TaxID=8319 RepID=A0AAV7Q8D7_PLEWA|nr:hypothetical protein NDU88_003021 [Pleurodeles waltl]